MSWTQYLLDHEETMRRRAWFYTITVGAFTVGALIGCMAVLRMGGRGVVWGLGLILAAGVLSFLKKRQIEKGESSKDRTASPAKDKRFMLQQYKNCGFSKTRKQAYQPDKVHLHQVGAYMPVF